MKSGIRGPILLAAGIGISAYGIYRLLAYARLNSEQTAPEIKPVAVEEQAVPEQILLEEVQQMRPEAKPVALPEGNRNVNVRLEEIPNPAPPEPAIAPVPLMENVILEVKHVPPLEDIPLRIVEPIPPRSPEVLKINLATVDDEALLECPITGEIMEDPVTTSNGQTYERAAIERWFLTHDTDPLLNLPLIDKKLVPNFAIKSIIEKYQRRREQFDKLDAKEEKTATHPLTLEELLKEQKQIAWILNALEEYAGLKGIYSLTKHHQKEAKDFLPLLRIELSVLHRAQAAEKLDKIAYIGSLLDSKKPPNKKSDFYKALSKVKEEMHKFYGFYSQQPQDALRISINRP